MAEKEYIEREAVNALIKAECSPKVAAYLIDAVATIPPADVVPGRDFRDCRNELCLRCGDYKQRYLGACDGCRWRADNV